ncbi:MAG: hypothetical protein IJB32_05115 [Clostridia bacterium]|nr:hypothetical protein [Clostridia bacterium]
MDKFGIFKLLNSFFNFNNQKDASSPLTTATSSPENSDLLTKLLNSINGGNALKTTAPENSESPPQKKAGAISKPLQAGMLNSMTSHDEFIKRVKQKNTQR